MDPKGLSPKRGPKSVRKKARKALSPEPKILFPGKLVKAQELMSPQVNMKKLSEIKLGKAFPIIRFLSLKGIRV